MKFHPLVTVATTVLLMVASPGLSVGETNANAASATSKTKLLSQQEAIDALIARLMKEHQLKAVLFGLQLGDEPVMMMGWGESMAGVPAAPDMQVRLGAISIAYLGSLLLQLVDEEVVALDDPVGKWLPELPKAESVTLRMLINCTSGYPDYVTYDKFTDAFYADVFRTWTPRELIDLALEQPLVFDPGENWHYAHTNFVILGLALEKATGHPMERMIQERIINRFDLEATTNPTTPAMAPPILQSYTGERGVYESATFWNPSWTLARGAVMNGTVADILTSARAIGTGTGLSDSSKAAMFQPQTAGMAIWNEQRWFGLGVVINQGWVVQNPTFHGYAGVMAYLPEQELSIAVYSTRLEGGDDDLNASVEIFEALTDRLTPAHSLAK